MRDEGTEPSSDGNHPNKIERDEGEWARADECSGGGGEEGGRVWGGLLSAIQFKNKAAKINKDVVTERRALAAAVKNAQDRTLKK